MTDSDELRDTPQIDEEQTEAAPAAEAEQIQAAPVAEAEVETVVEPTEELAGRIDDLAIPRELPIVPLKDTVIYPFVGAPLAVGQERTLKLIDDAVVGNRLVGFVAIKDANLDNPGPEDAYRVGVVGVILRMMRMPDGTMRLHVQGLERMRVEEYTQTSPYLRARIALAPDVADDSVEVDALS